MADVCHVLQASAESEAKDADFGAAKGCSLATECDAALVVDMHAGACYLTDAAATQPGLAGTLSLGMSISGVLHGFLPAEPAEATGAPAVVKRGGSLPGLASPVLADTGSAPLAQSLEQCSSLKSVASNAPLAANLSPRPIAVNPFEAAAVPVAPALAPRVFVIFSNGHGHEVLASKTYDAYVERSVAQRGTTQVLDDAPDGHSRLHRFVTQHDPCSAGVPPLVTAAAASVRAPDTAGFLDLLRRPNRAYPAPSTGLALPRIAALQSTQDIPHALPPVLVVREFRVFATLDADLRATCASVLAAHAAQLADLAARRTEEFTVADARSDEERALHASLLSQLQEMQGVGARAAEAVALRKRADRDAAAAAAAAEVAEAERVAAAKAAAVKPYRVWKPEVGEFDHCPQVPLAGSILGYFAAEDGLVALQTDPLLSSGAALTRKTLPSRHAGQPSATVFSTHGVYRTPKPPTSEAVQEGATREAVMEDTDPAQITAWSEEPQEALAGDGSPIEGYDSCGADAGRAAHMAPGVNSKLPNLYRKSKARVELNDAVCPFL